MPVRALVLALCLTNLRAQSDSRLLGSWACATREVVKDITGRVLDSGPVGERTLDLHGDQTASVGGVGEGGQTVLRVNAHWTGKPNKLTVQVDGEPNFAGSINKAGLLVLRSSILNRDRNTLRQVDWTCTKSP